MGIRTSVVVDHPRQAVFDWHGRPGAMPRLVPPWQPMTAVAEADDLADGRAVLGLPGGLRWIAQHNPQRYDPPHRFVDELSHDGRLRTWPPRLIGWWRHIHEFEEVTPTSTRVIDRLETPVPGIAFRSMFAYRHRQLADDLAAHALAAPHLPGPLTVAVTGARGLVGSALTALLTSGGHRVIRLVRPTSDAAASTDPDVRCWDPAAPAADLLAGVDAVVHLAGASIAGRFTDEHRRAVRDSRIDPTARLAHAAATTDGGPTTFVSASAVGVYGYARGDEELTEDSARGDGFLADVVTDWEAATRPAADGGLRTVQIRTGVVQAARGGTLKLLRPLFAAGLGGRLGDGRQWLSWIGIDDLVDVYLRALWDSRLSGPVNAVAPAPVRNSEYTDVLGRVLRRPTLLPVPSVGPKLLLGAQGARELALADQRVVPRRLAEVGHRFRTPQVEAVLRHQLGHPVG